MSPRLRLFVGAFLILTPGTAFALAVLLGVIP